jgi:hypothetical protein
VESTVSHILGYGGTTVSLEELRTCSTNELLELSDELLTAFSEELMGVSEEELARFSEELLGDCTDEEESASMASLLRRSWLSGISATEELDVFSGLWDASLLLGLLLSGSIGPATGLLSASSEQPLIKMADMPSNEATPALVALDKREFPITFFFSIFIKISFNHNTLS